MKRREVWGGREDGRMLKLPDELPKEVHMPYVDAFLPDDLEIAEGEEPTPFGVGMSKYIYHKESSTYRPKKGEKND